MAVTVVVDVSVADEEVVDVDEVVIDVEAVAVDVDEEVMDVEDTYVVDVDVVVECVAVAETAAKTATEPKTAKDIRAAAIKHTTTSGDSLTLRPLPPSTPASTTRLTASPSLLICRILRSPK